MKKIKFLLFAIIITAVLSVFFIFSDEFIGLFERARLGFPGLNFPDFEKEVKSLLIEKTEKQIVTPPPLKATQDSPRSFLSKEGLLEWTNVERKIYNLALLKENELLDESAMQKAEDMFARQYFAHISPSGEGVADLAEDAGYRFIIIGENLALGNFENDAALFAEWFASPGHQANILNENYRETGIAVKQGVFEGKTTWIAVQHFSLPLSACPEPNNILKEEIEKKEKEITEIEKELQILRSEIMSIKPKRGVYYNQKVDEYNSLAEKYNLLIKEIKGIINAYNGQVKFFNECLNNAR